MILECEKCGSRFLVADRLLAPSGRTVRCGACNHQWHSPAPEFAALAEEAAEAVEPLMADESDMGGESPSPMPEFTNVPALKKKRALTTRPFKIAAPLLAASWLGLATFTYAPGWIGLPGLSMLYGVMGIKTTDGLAFENVRMEQEGVEDRTKFILSGSIANHSPTVRTIPKVYVSLNDNKGTSIFKREYEVNAEVKPGDTYPFRIDNVETSFSQNVKTVVLDIGNAIQLSLR